MYPTKEQEENRNRLRYKRYTYFEYW
ncbi:hypothetical protein [Thermosipho africanus]